MLSIKSRLAAVIIALLAAPSASTSAAHAADATPPTTPGAPVFSQVTQFAVTITWAPSADDVGVANYLIRRNLPNGGSWNDSTPGNVTTITIRDLTPNNNYTFSIMAVDADANLSAPTAPASVRTLAYTAGSMCSVSYQALSAGAGRFQSQIAMTNLTPGAWQEWTLGFTFAPTQQVDPAWGFTRNGDRYTMTFVWLWSSGAGPLLPGATRSVSFSGTFTGTANPPPTEITINDHPCVVAGETRPPGPPANLTAGAVTPGSVSLTWSAATPGTSPIRGYEVLVNGFRYTCTGVNPLACLVSGLSPGTSYAFSVRAVDITGLVGAAATIVVRTPPSVPPSPPGNLTVTNVTATSATLSWTPSRPGSAPISGYVIHRVDTAGDVAIRVVPANSTSTTLTGLTPGTVYVMRVRARDTSSVTSAPSRTVTFTTR